MSDQLLKLVNVITEWHSHKLQHLRKIQESSKEGTTIKVNESDLEMSTRDALFFQIGMEAALLEFEELPFKATITPAVESDDEGDEE